MYPADHIWKNIRTELHGNPSWHALTLISLLVITSLTISTFLIAPSAGRYQFKQLAAIPKKILKPLEATSIHAPIAEDAYFNQIEPHQLTQATIAFIAPVDNIDLNAETAFLKPSEITTPAVPAIELKNTAVNKLKSISLNRSALFVEAFNPNSTIEATIPSITNNESIDLLQPAKPLMVKNLMTIQDEKFNAVRTPNKIQQRQKTSRIGYQFYITPSKSYRVLSDDAVKEIIQPSTVSNIAAQNIPLGLSYSAGVNDIVRHRPAIGLELGVSALYSITKRLKLKTGIQMNIRQYNIETFQTLTPNLTTVSLLNNRSIENINLFSSYSNN
ncbi:MAG: hypothetical protein EAZ41_01760, partial [Sphingobacteriia bacterium]